MNASRRPWLACLALLAWTSQGCGTVEPQAGAGAAPEPTRVYDAQTLFNTLTVFGTSISHDDSRLLLTSDESGVFNVYSQPLDGSPRTALTSSTDNPIFGLAWFPEDDRFLYSRDQGGNEITHVHVRELDGGDVDLMPEESARSIFAGFSHDLRSMYLTSNARDPRFMDLYVCPIQAAGTGGIVASGGPYEVRLLYQNDDGYSLGPVSNDGRWLSVQRTLSNADDDLYLIDLMHQEAEPLHVTPHQGPISHSAMDFSADSRNFFYTSDEGSEFQRVLDFDIEQRTSELAYQGQWDVIAYRFSYNGRYLSIAENADASTELTVLDTRTGQPVALPEIPDGDVTNVAFSRSESLMTFGVNGDTSPTNLYVVDLPTRQLTRLTDTLNPAVDREDLVEGQIVRYFSFDQLEIPAILFRPKDASRARPVPAVVFVHGGPGGQTRKGYRADIQFLANHGYAVLAVNNRGSSGYGKTFFHLDDRRHGEDDLSDCIHGRRYLETLSWVDGDRVAIMGGSYGGYLVAAALAFAPEAFGAGIDIFGVTNWQRTLESIPSWWTAEREALYAELGDPEADRERLRRISPLFHAKQIVKPLMVVQGQNDPRVLKVESDELVAAVRANDVPVEYLVFPDEGHGFRNRKNRIAAAEGYLRFLEAHLK